MPKPPIIYKDEKNFYTEQLHFWNICPCAQEARMNSEQVLQTEAQETKEQRGVGKRHCTSPFPQDIKRIPTCNFLYAHCVSIFKSFFLFLSRIPQLAYALSQLMHNHQQAQLTSTLLRGRKRGYACVCTVNASPWKSLGSALGSWRSKSRGLCTAAFMSLKRKPFHSHPPLFCCCGRCPWDPQGSEEEKWGLKGFGKLCLLKSIV